MTPPPPTGRFWAVGVGPGDPGLLTLRALEVLRRAAVVYHAGPRDRQGRAWQIVRPHLRPEQEVRRVLTTAMGEIGPADWRAHYRPGVEQIAADCRRGLDVACVTEGDPTLYSTASYVWELLRELAPDIAVEVVPGVTSVTAAAARLAWTLARRGEPLLLAPASYHARDLASWLERWPNVCLLKVPSAFPSLLSALEALGPRAEAAYAENVGTEREWLARDVRTAAGRDEYFSLVLVRRVEPAADEGRPGRIWVVGLGPGDPELLTGQARQVLERADDLVGYEAYLKQVAGLGLRGRLHPSPIGAEAARASLALELARGGREVALVSSGDAGVYGMASLLLETAGPSPGVAVEIVPGVTAATAAAARLGAPLGHDFACISLSDLLTPWPVIERRLDAAGRGDFVVVLYNPVSRRRTWQLPRARDVLLRHRPPATPVGLVTGAYRPGMEVRQTTLGELTADGVTMETAIVVGSTQTRVIDGRLVTPRGYAVLGTPHLEPVAAAAEPDPGRRILRESFALIERELGPLDLPPWAYAVVRRMIHASADFELARLLRYSPDFERAFRQALRDRAAVVTDTEMVRLGIRTALRRLPEVPLVCHLNDPETARDGLTRSAAGLRRAAGLHARPVLVLGNAPTAVEEALRLVREEGWRPAAILAMPVGFVGVVEAKERLLAQGDVPYLTCLGRKGGSAVAAAAFNALVEDHPEATRRPD